MSRSSPTSLFIPAGGSDPGVATCVRKERIAVEEIAARLSIGRLAVYALLDRGEIPAIRLGRRWIVTRYAYEQWERTCGTDTRGRARDLSPVQSSYGRI
jgi:excisionase family DNA binding protein